MLSFILAAAIGVLQPQIINIQDRTLTSLDGDWDYLVDQFANGYLDYRQNPMPAGNTFFADKHFFTDQTRLVEYDFDAAEKMKVPGDWNTQGDKFYYFESTIWFRRVFEADPQPGKRYFIHFGAVNYEAVAGLNGKGVEGWVQLDGASREAVVSVEIPELGIRTETNADGISGKATFYAQFKKKKQPERWSPENPRLYEVKIASGEDSTTDRIGFRTIETKGCKILINRKETFLKGVAIHEEIPFAPCGRAFSEEHARITLGLAKEMGCNFVRLAHYPYNENMVRVAEMITRDKNRANVIIWSVSNETPRSKARLDFLTGLIAKAREMDPTRLVSSAMEKDEPEPGHMTVKDDLIDYVDLISYNQYVGWYDGDFEKCDRVYWSFPVEKPVIITEFGGGAKFGRHGAVTDRFTEEYQAKLYEKNIEMLSRIPELAGASPWILKDFRSPRRQLNGIQDEFNRKGLVSENGEKKKAFFIMQEWYSRK